MDGRKACELLHCSNYDGWGTGVRRDGIAFMEQGHAGDAVSCTTGCQHWTDL